MKGSGEVEIKSKDCFKILEIINKLMNLFVSGGQTNCLSPGDKIFYTQVGGGQTNCLSPGDKHFLHTEGGTNIFLMMMKTVGNVSGANILSSEARKPPAGARIPGPVGP